MKKGKTAVKKAGHLFNSQQTLDAMLESLDTGYPGQTERGRRESNTYGNNYTANE